MIPPFRKIHPILLCALLIPAPRPAAASVSGLPDGSAAEIRAFSFSVEGGPFHGILQARYRFRPRFHLGLEAGAGPGLRIPITETVFQKREQAVEIAHAGICLDWSPFDSGLDLQICPLRISLLRGRDWAQVYPSGHLRLIFRPGKVFFTTRVTLIRVPGGGETLWLLQWIPISAGYTF